MDFVPLLTKSFENLQQVTFFIQEKAKSDPSEGAGPATDYLKMFALTAIAYVWTRYADISYNKQNDDPKGFYRAKIESGKFYMNKLLPETQYLMSSIMSGATSYTNYDDVNFETGTATVTYNDETIVGEDILKILSEKTDFEIIIENEPKEEPSSLKKFFSKFFRS